MKNENSQVAPRLEDDYKSTTEKVSAAGTGKEDFHQEKERENQPEKDINDDEQEGDVNNDDDDNNIIINDDVDSTDNDINESDDSEDEVPFT